MTRPAVSRRSFLQATGVTAGALSLQFGTLSAAAQTTNEAASETAKSYRRFEDIYRNKWTWDRVARSTHGTNCAGNCAFNVYVRNGVVWREEQQAMYGASGDDVPDYGPRGCQKGLRHAKYMYGKQRVLYPMKRKEGTERGEGKWERISWDQAASEIADKIIDYSLDYGPDSISLGSGTQLSVKLASYASLSRFANITGVTVPEFYSGVGDLPTGVYMTLGSVYVGDTMAAIYKSRCVFIWMSNPAVTRIPDAHFFWEAKYNGTKVIAISPEFTPSAMHSSKWINPKPGTDTALAMAIIDTILKENLYDAGYIKEQTDLPFLVRKDTGEFLREEHMSTVGMLAVRDNVFYVWDEAADKMAKAPATGLAERPMGRDRRRFETLDLGDIKPALEGSWTVNTRTGPVEVTTAFEILKQRAEEHSPENTAEITGLNPNVVRGIARDFANAKPAMIYTGYASCKWLHGDMLQRAMLLMLSLTGNIGPEGSGIQFSNAPEGRNLLAFAFAGVGPALRIISGTNWDYEQANMIELTKEIYGEELANTYHKYYQESIDEDYFPSYGKKGWKMGIFAGNNGANWRASGPRWKEQGMLNCETVVTMAPDMGVTAQYSDYVLPIAHHYERRDFMLQARVPYAQALDKCVEPVGESVDDWTAFNRLTEKISERAKERGVGAIRDDVDGNTVRRDFRQYHNQYTINGTIKSVDDVIQYLINTTPGMPTMTVDEFVAKGIVRVEGSETTQYHKGSPYHAEILESVYEKRPYETLTSRQQFYIDHEWFLEFDEAFPGHKEPLRIEGYPLQMMMGHARHGIHSMWRDDHLMLALQRGEPDIYVNPDDAKARGAEDGDLLRVFNTAGEFYAQAHVSAGIQPGMLFMYHGWDPMMFKERKNFSAVIPTAGLIKPTSMAGDYGHLGYQILAFAPNQTYKDFTCDFEKADRDVLQEASL